MAGDFEWYHAITSPVESRTFRIPAASVIFGSRLYTNRLLDWHGLSLSLVQEARLRSPKALDLLPKTR